MPGPQRALALLGTFSVVAALVLTAFGAPTAALTDSDARHLLARTAFTPLPRDIDALVPLELDQAVTKLLSEARREAVTPAPDWVEGWRPPERRMRELDEASRKALRKEMRSQAIELKAWWYREMVATPTPITEVMTLFWHGHFTSGLRKVKAPALLYRQNALLRRHAVGNFATMLREITRDPAMLLYLDSARSRRNAPNENFAREFFELFTLGEGHYEERDIKEAARAFTGYSINRRSGEFRFRQAWHDQGEKTILGRRGRFDGDDVVDIVLAHPRTAEHLVEKLWRALISDQPEPSEVARMAAVFRNGNYEIAPLLQVMLTSDAFLAETSRGGLIRSPVDLLVGTVRLFDIPVRDGRNLAMAGRLLGQDLFEPPNVKGWPGGAAWITSESLVDRQSILRFVAGDPWAMTGREDKKAKSGATKRDQRAAAYFSGALDRWVDKLDSRWSASQSVALLLAPLPPVDNPIMDRYASGALVRQLLLDPVYQLK